MKSEPQINELEHRPQTCRQSYKGLFEQAEKSIGGDMDTLWYENQVCWAGGFDGFKT